ncbi:four-carbon acid sugar kinase family protein [Paenibacillus sedimenti]|uniref:Hydroxyacid dehydrogenase n=1 Tax=Paenibacillus sedimenti TaxID=2770274 RepID=A0A926QH95_9BACL|nr:four-carbon acid sugar kinase family protein [Paenibacillus sedimenti]MBD0379270.1 hydroxyacid dehydrogenase [Paenibacillus sedimenti]
MSTGAVSISSIESQLPPEWQSSNYREQIRQINQTGNKKIIVLDDDPTGVQTVHDVDVLTQWDKELLREAFNKPETVFYILTNTRAYQAAEVERINREIAQNVQAVASETGIDFVFVSRGDSTLRGYYPLETDTLRDELHRMTGLEYDGHLIIPAFFEAGRVTYQHTHFIKEDDKLLPVHQTEFAKDKVFGYEHSDLAQWVEEKTKGRIKSDDCVVISLEQVRSGPDAVEEILLNVEGNAPIIVDCLSYADLDVLAFALLQAEQKGKKYIFRTAASFVKAYGGIADQDILPKEKLIAKGQETHGGLVVVGSHVQKTTRQLEQLLKGTDIISLEMDVNKILNPAEKADETKRLISKVNEYIARGKNVVVFSSRKLIAVDSSEGNLNISQTVSESLVKIVRSLDIIPKFIIAKGGITSSDVATKGLGIRKARIIGQAAAGIPVWLTGEEAKFSGIPYIVFPGNVGSDTTLLETVQKIEG